MNHLVPVEGRSSFYKLVATDRDANYALDREVDPTRQTAAFLARQRLYTRQAMAALDLGRPPERVQAFFAEAALAGKLYVEIELPRPQPFHSFMAFFGLQVTGDEAALVKTSEAYLARTSPELKHRVGDAHLDMLLRALAASIAGQSKLVAASLSQAKKLPPNAKSKSHGQWIASLRDLAGACLLDAPPRDPSPLLVEVAARTRAHFGKADIEDQIFEPYLNRIALALVAQARARGAELTGENPDPSMRLDLLRLPPSKLPSHPSWDWPKPSKEDLAAVDEALRIEQSQTAAADERGAKAGKKAPAKEPRKGKTKGGARR